ncbi:TetR/AcrR family transcriptional regulator [Georgenia ruanii]|nr:TetR/AcrR family transcriptional regulator [Georgenia ruanii]MPV88633.1 TetR family transcriptional regulator [Georgenia ruanii]
MTQPQAVAGEATQETKRGPGRPRHADTEDRAYRAVLDLFGQRGWAGVSLDAVASHAGIGKSSIYLRWKDKHALLLDAVRHLEAGHVNPDPGLGIRDYLVAHARGRAELMLGPHGPMIANVVSAAVANPTEFAEIRDESISQEVLALVARVERAIADGELPPSTSTSQVVDPIEGTVYFHFLMARAGAPREELAAGLEQYVTGLVDLVLRGLGG